MSDPSKIFGPPALDIHGWLRSYEARTAVDKARALPRPISPAWRGPSCAFTISEGIYQWTGSDDRVRPIKPFRTIKTEQEIAKLYCEPNAYYHCVLFLQEGPEGLFTFDERNKPEKWLDAVSKYLALTGQGEVGLAAKQLHRLIEAARKEFREAQDRAWGHRKVTEHTPEGYERKEAAAWRKFSHAKQTFLQRYDRAIKSGVVERVKRKKARICPQCGKEPLRPRQRKCNECRRETRRERNKRYVSGLKNHFKTGSLLGIRRPKIAIPLPPYSPNQQDALTVLEMSRAK
jgi:PAS domain-containing protein